MVRSPSNLPFNFPLFGLIKHHLYLGKTLKVFPFPDLVNPNRHSSYSVLPPLFSLFFKFTGIPIDNSLILTHHFELKVHRPTYLPQSQRFCIIKIVPFWKSGFTWLSGLIIFNPYTYHPRKIGSWL